MSSTEARTTDGGETGPIETRDDASSAAERLGGPLEGEQRRDRASEAETDVGRRADPTAGEGEQSPDRTSEAEAVLAVEPNRPPAKVSNARTGRAS